MKQILQIRLILVAALISISGQNAFATKYAERHITGKYNNIKKQNWGKAGCPLARFAKANYENRRGEIDHGSKPSPRQISNEIFKQETTELDERKLSDMVWQWGQFLDHDLDLSPENHDEPMPIEVPTGDEIFDPQGAGDVVLTFFRSLSRIGKRSKTRTQMNMITSYIDASNVYGSDPIRARVLRELNNKGRLKVSSNNLLPYNLFGLENAGGDDNKKLFLAGDVRANEQIGLVAMHTLFVREHNRKASEIATANPDLSDEEIYQKTREYVGALMQQITYNEFLPALLGENALKPYNGYKKRVRATIGNEFATFAYRFGHSAVSPEILKVDNEGQTLGEIKVMESFFKPELMDSDSLGHMLKGLSAKGMQKIDSQVMDGLRNFLFIDVPGMPMLDLVSLNIQRGRDHGIADINTIRQRFKLSPYNSFSEITSNKELATKLEKLYGTVENADPFVVALAEDHVTGSSLGETIRTILINQFERLRDGDRFYFENKMSAADIAEIKATRLSDIIKRNTQISNIPENTFVISQ
jgi:peroxidase